MAKELSYFIGGMAVIALPLAVYLAIRWLGLLDIRPDAHMVYAQGPAGPLALHAFPAAPDAGGKPPPALLLFHGGGWAFGSPRDVYPQCRFFQEQGYSCFAAEYRLGPGSPPDIHGALEDAALALEHLHAQASELAINPQAIFAGGGSAGGQLAAALGAGLHGAARIRPAALVLLNPVLDFAPCTPFHHLAGERWRDLSPLQAVTDEFPPTLILSGTEDIEVPVASVNAFCTAVTDAGGECATALYDGQGHSFFNYRKHDHNPYFDRTNDRMVAFLNAQPR